MASIASLRVRRDICAAVLAAASLLVAGCGEATHQPSYNPALIRQIVAGSVPLGRFPPIVEEMGNFTGSFTEPEAHRTQTRLLKGEVTKLTTADLNRLAAAERRAARGFAPLMTRAGRLASQLDRARLDPSVYRDLSPGAKQFAAVWNDELAKSAVLVRAVRQNVLTARPPSVRWFHALLAAAYAARLRRTIEFERVRHEVIAQLRPTVTNFENRRKAIAAKTAPGAGALEQQVRDNPDARVILEQAKKQRPELLAGTQS